MGDQLFGDDDGDRLYGNQRQELLDGGGGNDLLGGDLLDGPNYAWSVNADTVGADDVLIGGAGEDQLLGGGGDDQLWGGADTDLLEGQQGVDQAYGGAGIDLFVLYLANGEHDHLDGHGDNRPAASNPVADDHATDILVVDGTSQDDTILISQTTESLPRLRVDHSSLTQPLLVDWLDPATGRPLIEQIQIAGLAGNDRIGFAQANPLPGMSDFALVDPSQSAPLDLSLLGNQTNDFVGVFDGNGGDDILVGAAARDRLDGGSGSDVIFGLGGDDRLWGDTGDGFSSDHDILYAGTGNDDLLAGQGDNELYAWSFHPDAGRTPESIVADGPGPDFGVFVDPDGSLHETNGGGDYVLENTGLNRMLGNVGDDYLFGGTVLDFMYGAGGQNVLLRRDGSTFDSFDQGLIGDQWKAYARDTGQVWYVSGSNADDQITIDYVSEPGLLGDHHLITRLTDNGGNFSFAAQVRLDFNARDEDGNTVWDPADILLDYQQLRDAQDMAARGVALANLEVARTNLVGGLLPPEGDFLAILVDALDGNDRITVGPTVQKSVWIDAGPGDDTVEILAGNAILVDRAESVVSENGLRGRNDIASQAFPLDLPTSPGVGRSYSGLTLDNPTDVDWYRFALAEVPASNSSITVTSDAPADQFTISVFAASDPENALATVSGTGGSAELSLSGLGLSGRIRLSAAGLFEPDSDDLPVAV